MGHPLFHLELSVRRADVSVRLNDFPVAHIAAGDTPANFAPPINPYLVGDLNVLDVTIAPWLGGGAPTTFDDAEVQLWVRRYEKGEIVIPGQGPVVTETGVPDTLVEQVREEELELPVAFSHVFSNDAVDFSDELSSAPPFDDPSALRDYAVRLRDLFDAGDVQALTAESEPRSRAWSVAYDHPLDEIRASMQGELGEVVAAPLVVGWDRDDVELRPVSGGRLWELARIGGLPLIQTEPDADGARMHFEIFAAPREGRLRWVR